MKKLTIGIIAVLFIGLIFVSGCAGNTDSELENNLMQEDIQLAEETKIKNLEVTSLIIRDKDKNGLADGIDFELKPIDKGGNFVNEGGVLDITMWSMDCSGRSATNPCGVSDCKMAEDDLLDFWVFEVKPSSANIRPKVSLSYEMYEATEDESVTGCMKVTMVTEDGSSFDHIVAPIKINDA